MPNNIANLIIHQNKLEKQLVHTTNSLTDLVSTLNGKLDLTIQILTDIRDKDAFINIDGSTKKVLLEKSKEEILPFTPSINTSNGKIQAKEIGKRTKSKDLAESVDKLSKANP